MLIDSEGEKQGIVTIEEAVEAANKISLDLVQVSPSDANPVVCKLLDYGKHMFDKKKSISASKVKVKRNTTKGDKNIPPGPVKIPPKKEVIKYSPKLVSCLSQLGH